LLPILESVHYGRHLEFKMAAIFGIAGTYFALVFTVVHIKSLISFT